jgi:hypothetical protein
MNKNLKEIAKEYLEISSKFDKEAYDNIESIVINELGSSELKEIYNIVGAETLAKLFTYYEAKHTDTIKLPDKHEFTRLASSSIAYFLKFVLRLKPRVIKELLKLDDLKEIFLEANKVDKILIKKIEEISTNVYRPNITEQNKESSET